ncbi:hypothetical protein COT47_01630 [Candidatus Woesearchaeota archaeon CG08_land_8_20_14_0_20_43_7]|nr:MAG: hypothetical protein COT47_01630 [Candidatus Woesearchaeota archaeon CG08_land_8_20_14_0_20_43_7]
MECKKEVNKKNCNCTYSGCPRHGVCCDCVSFHRSRGEIPACFFPDDVEKTWDRSIEKFVEINK